STTLFRAPKGYGLSRAAAIAGVPYGFASRACAEGAGGTISETPRIGRRTMTTVTNPAVTELLRDGSRVTIREVRPDDKAALNAFFEGLSAHSKHLLFLGGGGPLRGRGLSRVCPPGGGESRAVGARPRGAA